MCENMVTAICTTIWKSQMTKEEIRAASKMKRLWYTALEERNKCPIGSHERLEWNKALDKMFGYAIDRGWNLYVKHHWVDGMYEYGDLVYCVKWR